VVSYFSGDRAVANEVHEASWSCQLLSRSTIVLQQCRHRLRLLQPRPALVYEEYWGSIFTSSVNVWPLGMSVFITFQRARNLSTSSLSMFHLRCSRTFVTVSTHVILKLHAAHCNNRVFIITMHAILVYDDREYHGPGYVAVIVLHLSLHPQLQQKMCHSQLEDLLQLTGIENHAQYSNRCRRRRAAELLGGMHLSVMSRQGDRPQCRSISRTLHTTACMSPRPRLVCRTYVCGLGVHVFFRSDR
jgi:hypothetical protein